jgi:hypothetical protein
MGGVLDIDVGNVPTLINHQVDMSRWHALVAAF